MFPIKYCLFLVRVKTFLIKMGSWIYILMANEVYIVILILYFKRGINFLSLNLLRKQSPKLQSRGLFLSPIKLMK